MNIKSIIITIKKEIRSILRDKKTLITLLVFPVLIPLMIILYAYIYDIETQETNYNIAINYQLNTTEKSLLTDCNLTPIYYQTIKEMKKAYNNQEVSAYIDYDQEKNTYTIYTNEDSEEGMYVSSYITTYLDSYNTYLAQLYLIGEDIDVDTIYNNFNYTIENLDGENFFLNIIFSIAFTYIIASIVLTATNMATSATAVEKENGTLETLLTFPVKSSDLIIGKYLAAVIASFIASLIGLILTILGILIAGTFFNVFQNISFSINPLTILIGIIICFAASLFISGLSIAITSFTKTYKEAQSSSQVLNIVVLIPMMISLIGINITTIYYFIPIANYVQLLMDIFENNINISNIFITLFSTIIYIIIVIKYIIKQYKSEKVLFGV